MRPEKDRQDTDGGMYDDEHLGYGGYSWLYVVELWKQSMCWRMFFGMQSKSRVLTYCTKNDTYCVDLCTVSNLLLEKIFLVT